MLRAGGGVGLLVTVGLALAAAAAAPPERNASFPDGSVGSVPPVRAKADQVLTVCKSNSKRLIKRSFPGRQFKKKRNLRLRQLKSCRFRHIQSAVNRARNGA